MSEPIPNPVITIPVNTVYPNDQQIIIDPYNAKLFDYNDYQSRVYLSRTINQLLRVFGENCIIDNLKIEDVLFDNNELRVIIRPGKVIIDMTFIEFPTPTELILDISDIPDYINTFVVSLAYNYLHNTYGNKARFRLTYVDTFGKSPNFYTEMDKIILTKITVDRENQLFSLVPSYYLNPEYITINDVRYKIFPADNITNNIIKVVKELFY